jgi:hypothetical protein
VASRQQSAARAIARQKPGSSRVLHEEDFDSEIILGAPRSPHPSSKLMEGIKEELFQLEVERKKGQISQAEYENAKAALDQTLERALRREAQKQA